jgi:two-component system chemotaxis response regulator CheB
MPYGYVRYRTYTLGSMPRNRQPGCPAYAAYDVVVVAASAGGIQALVPLLENLPTGFSSPIIVVVHLPPASRYVSVLARILQRKTSLKVKWAEDGECLVAGTVYVAPQDRSTEINTQTRCLLVLQATALPKLTPDADLLFNSAAQTFGKRSLAVVLSGVLSDGAAGSAAIALAGGRVLSQSATEAQFPDMPSAARKRSHVESAFDSISLAHVIGNLVMIPGVAAWLAIGMPRPALAS